ncbi:MAG: glycosyltransferase family A protein [Pseudomonadota bacterium]
MSDPTGAPASTSIVIPAFNARETIAEAIESALGQGVAPDRVIVVDDGSGDDTARTARRLNGRVKVITVPNGGPARARNTGLSLVTTHHVLFLDADDAYEGPFALGLEAAAKAAGADLAFGTTTEITAGGKRGVPVLAPTAQGPAFAAAWLNGHSVQTNAYFWRTAFLRRIGGFCPTMRILEEIECVARAVLSGARLAHSQQGTALYRHTDSPSRVSFGSSRQVIQSAVDGFAGLADHPLADDAVRRAIGGRLYAQARAAHRLGYRDLGREAEALARALGFVGHQGSRGHRVGASLLGLERKEAWRRALA